MEPIASAPARPIPINYSGSLDSFTFTDDRINVELTTGERKLSITVSLTSPNGATPTAEAAELLDRMAPPPSGDQGTQRWLRGKPTSRIVLSPLPAAPGARRKYHASSTGDGRRTMGPRSTVMTPELIRQLFADYQSLCDELIRSIAETKDCSLGHSWVMDEIASKYNIASTHAYAIIRRKSWTWVELPAGHQRFRGDDVGDALAAARGDGRRTALKPGELARIQYNKRKAAA